MLLNRKIPVCDNLVPEFRYYSRLQNVVEEDHHHIYKNFPGNSDP